MPHRHRQFSLFAKLILSFALLIVLPFTLSMRLLNLTAAKNIRDNTSEYVELFSRQIVINLENYFDELNRLTRTTLLNTELINALTCTEFETPMDKYNNTSVINKQLFTLSMQQVNIHSIILLDKDNEAYVTGIANSISDYPRFFEIADQEQIRSAAGKLVIFPAHSLDYLYHSDGKPVFALGRLIKDQNYQIAGMLYLILDCNDILNLIDVGPVLKDNGGTIVVTTSNGSLVANSDGLYGEDFSADVFNRSDQYFTVHSSSSTWDVSVDIHVPTDKLFYSVQSFERFSRWTTRGLIIVLILLSVYLSHRFVRPIRKLTQAADAVRDGNFQIQTNIFTNDEIGHLSQSFDLMICKINDLIQNVYTAELHQKQAQLEALQQQINPHFLFNTLESIRMKAVVNQDIEVAIMIKNLGKLFRITLDRHHKNNLVADEIKHVKAYVDLQNIRYDNRFSLHIDLDDSLLLTPVISLIFQPIIENSILHGYEHTNEPGDLYISGEDNGDSIIFSIHDNGIGIQPEALAAQNKMLQLPIDFQEEKDIYKNIGLRNISCRLMLEYGPEHALYISSSKERSIAHGIIYCFFS